MIDLKRIKHLVSDLETRAKDEYKRGWQRVAEERRAENAAAKWALRVIGSLVLFALAACGIRGDKVFGVIELVDKVIADEAAWTGKEVSVSGHVSATSNSNDPNAFLDLRNDRTTSIERHVSCKIASGMLPEGVAGKTIVVKGTVGKVYRQNYLDQRKVTLDSCEITR